MIDSYLNTIYHLKDYEVANVLLRFYSVNLSHTLYSISKFYYISIDIFCQ